ncbi:hypothetical protein BKI52_12225 [marine bacterium AO1-C]|nr:hypothetical protein BKI52_12225 [marine bacterium AO1-C]
MFYLDSGDQSNISSLSIYLMKTFFPNLCLILLLLISFQSCSNRQLNENNFFTVHAKNNINKLIENRTLDVEKDDPRQNISQSYENIDIVYQINPQKQCIFSIQAFFRKLNTNAKILNWVKQNKVSIVNRKKFDKQLPFQIRGIHGLIFDCKRIQNGSLEVTRAYYECL